MLGEGTAFLDTKDRSEKNCFTPLPVNLLRRNDQYVILTSTYFIQRNPHLFLSVVGSSCRHYTKSQNTDSLKPKI